jgi:hypothetical protein
VDGAICAHPGTGQTTVAFGAYPPALEFLSKGLYFSKIEPYLRFRHREVSTISWTIYRISKENRYLFARTEGLKVYQLQTTGEAERFAKALQYLRYLEDYPGQRFTTVSRLQQSAEWQVQALDLTPYYKEGDGVVIVASVPKSENSAAVQDTDDTEADSEASTAGESGQRLMPVLPVPAELRITPSIKPTWLRWARTAAHLGDTGVFYPSEGFGALCGSISRRQR